MAHVTKIVAWQELSNGQHSYLFRCCNDQSSDHWHTVSVSLMQDKEKLEAGLREVHAFVAQQHDDAQQLAAKSALGDLPVEVQHG